MPTRGEPESVFQTTRRFRRRFSKVMVAINLETVGHTRTLRANRKVSRVYREDAYRKAGTTP